MRAGALERGDPDGPTLGEIAVAGDRTRAEEAGLDPGGDIMIHGVKPGVDHPATDWTQGCIAVTDAEIEEIGGLVADGTTIEIYP